MQWLYEAFYTAIGELFADINNLGVEIFDLSWVQAMVSRRAGAAWVVCAVVVGTVVSRKASPVPELPQAESRSTTTASSKECHLFMKMISFDKIMEFCHVHISLTQQVI